MTVTDQIKYIGVNDHEIDLFEGQYLVPLGMAYNSYVILDEKIAVMDTVDRRFGQEWLENLEKELQGRRPDYLVIQHMEPDHSANIVEFLKKYPETEVVGNAKTFSMMDQFFEMPADTKRVTVANGGTLSLGAHELNFVFAPMVHWPEVMLTYESSEKVLFSADAFGKFGANDVDDPEGWDDEAARYYIGIVGKYGVQVQTLLKKAAALEIAMICPLHGPVLTENLGHYIGLYDTWSAYRPEKKCVTIAYTSVYGHTKEAAEYLAEAVREKGEEVQLFDLARADMAKAVESAFRGDRLVLATTTYNGDIYPFMKDYIERLVERNFQNRTVALVENGTWAPTAARVMSGLFEKSKNLTFIDGTVTIRSAVKADTREALRNLADALCNA